MDKFSDEPIRLPMSNINHSGLPESNNIIKTNITKKTGITQKQIVEQVMHEKKKKNSEFDKKVQSFKAVIEKDPP